MNEELFQEIRAILNSEYGDDWKIELHLMSGARLRGNWGLVGSKGNCAIFVETIPQGTFYVPLSSVSHFQAFESR